jgi:hypothetical protein
LARLTEAQRRRGREAERVESRRTDDREAALAHVDARRDGAALEADRVVARRRRQGAFSAQLCVDVESDVLSPLPPRLHRRAGED